VVLARVRRDGGFGSLFVYTFSVFVKPLAAESAGVVKPSPVASAIAAVTLGLCSPLLGRWIDRYGPRRIILICMTVYGCAIASLSLSRSGLWQFLRDLLRAGCGWERCSAPGLFAVHFHMVSAAFGDSVGVGDGGSGFGRHDFTVVAQSIISRSGWRAAYASLGALALLLGLPLSWRYIRERGAVGHESAPIPHSGMTWQQGLRSFPFWILTAILFVSSISMNGAITHLSALLTDRGLTAGSAALCASILGGSSLLGRVVVGWLLDRFFGPRVALVINLITALGIFLLARANSFRRVALLLRSLASGRAAKPRLHLIC